MPQMGPLGWGWIYFLVIMLFFFYLVGLYYFYFVSLNFDSVKGGDGGWFWEW